MFVELIFADWVLRIWKKNPTMTRRQIGLDYSWKSDSLENDKPLTAEEVTGLKNRLRERAPKVLYDIFPEERDGA